MGVVGAADGLDQDVHGRVLRDGENLAADGGTARVDAVTIAAGPHVDDL